MIKLLAALSNTTNSDSSLRGDKSRVALPTPAPRAIARWHASCRQAAVLALAAAAMSSAVAQTPSSSASIDRMYVQERAACLDGRTHQSRSTCLKEAAAAHGEAKRKRLSSAHANLRANALSRCEMLPHSQQEECVERVINPTHVSGDPANGGVYRELRTTLPAADPIDGYPPRE